MRIGRLLLIGMAILSPIGARDPVSDLNERLERGTAHLVSRPGAGYLQSILDALNIPVESQVMPFSQTSFQAKLIGQDNPRALYFTDDVVVGWVRGSPLMEAAAVDPKRGVAFYTLNQTSEKPRFQSGNSCLSCHQSGLFVLSNDGSVTDHRTPLAQRWGGWYVTGISSGFRHEGNRVGQGWLRSLYDQFYTAGYPTEYSDIVALMVLEHQTQATNSITRVAREPDRDSVNELVDYLLFVDEARLPGRVIGTSGFTQKFATFGPYDRKGRSLRQFDLTRRMMRYPCSYMIYSKAFAALPSTVKAAVYARMWRVLAGFSPRDRQAVTEILFDTMPGLPPYFHPAVSETLP